MGISLKPVALNHPNDFYPITWKLKKVEKQIQYRGFRYSMVHKGNLKAALQHPNESYPLMKMNMEMKRVEKQIPKDPPHWEFCYSVMNKLTPLMTLLICSLDDKELRNAACVWCLVLRAVDNVEDEPNISDEVKVPVLEGFHRHIYDRDFRFTCGGTKEKRDIMDNFHHLSTAFLDLNKSYQEKIEDSTMKLGVGMAKFLSKEIDTIDDYEEYSYIAGPLVTLGFESLFQVAGKQIVFPDSLSSAIGHFPRKVDVIKDYMEDIREQASHAWPREIWSKYASNLKDLTYEENSENALQCVNEMVTNDLAHMNDCLEFLSQLHDPSVFNFFAIIEVLAIGYLALCYNNIQVFRTEPSFRHGLVAQIFVRTKTMADVYGAFYDFSSIIRSKVHMNDPNAKTTISRIESVQKLCRDSGTSNKWKSYILESANLQPGFGNVTNK